MIIINHIIKFDVNTISLKQLKQLGRDVNKCIKGNNKNNNDNNKLSLINNECHGDSNLNPNKFGHSKKWN